MRQKDSYASAYDLQGARSDHNPWSTRIPTRARRSIAKTGSFSQTSSGRERQKMERILQTNLLQQLHICTQKSQTVWTDHLRPPWQPISWTSWTVQNPQTYSAKLLVASNAKKWSVNTWMDVSSVKKTKLIDNPYMPHLILTTSLNNHGKRSQQIWSDHSPNPTASMQLKCSQTCRTLKLSTEGFANLIRDRVIQYHGLNIRSRTPDIGQSMGTNMQTTQHQMTFIHRLSPRNWWSDGKGKSRSRSVPSTIYQLPPGQLEWMVCYHGIQLQ